MFMQKDIIRNQSQIQPLVVYNIQDKIPEDRQFIAFICPEQKDRWEIGWCDWNNIRVEAGPSYEIKKLTNWFALPEIPLKLDLIGETNMGMTEDQEKTDDTDRQEPIVMKRVIELLESIVQIREYQNKPSIVNQGQCLDGFSALAYYDSVADKIKTFLEERSS